MAGPFEMFALSDLLTRRSDAGTAFMEFLRVDAMSAGLYALPAGGTDPQQPHTEDELYYVIAGRAQFSVDEEGGRVNRTIEPGATIFVKAGVPHRFHDIVEDLMTLVLFAPARRRSG